MVQTGGPLYGMFLDNNYYRFLGILSALNIYVAEKYKKELLDFLPFNNDSLIEQLFVNTLIWRSGDSFTDRTLELFNRIRGHGLRDSKLSILLSVSVEPFHPWNADRLHKNLIKLSMPDRDAFWSTHIAIEDSSLYEEDFESEVNSIIEWAQYGDLSNIEREQVRLCSTVLMWVASTPNRKLRDQAAKSMVRLLSTHPDLLIGLMEKFEDADDLYVLERLYSIAYGVILNNPIDEIVASIGEYVYSIQFKNRFPKPHLLLRDYARGICEFTLHRNLFSSEINPAIFRPPYHSKWPLENPSQLEIGSLGDKFSSDIIDSIMGFPGDFGNYSMGGIHYWSPTSIQSEQPESAYELQLKFSQKLPEDLKKRFVLYINRQRELEKKRWEVSAQDKWERMVNDEGTQDQSTDTKNETSEYDLLKEEIAKIQDASIKEEFRWVMGLGKYDRPGAFSRKWAQRWVCKRAFELGWTAELFGEFEKYHTPFHSRSAPIKERVGKKYQWIAYFDFLAHLSDNCHFIKDRYGDELSNYEGPWQLHDRNIDPTCWLRKTGDSGWDEWSKKLWYQPFVFPLLGETKEELDSWLWDRSTLPPFKELVQVCNSSSNEEWFVLKSFSHWRNRKKEENDELPDQEAWYRINTCIIRKEDVNSLEKWAKGKNLCDPHVVYTSSTGHQGFLREYPWHPIYSELDDWHEPSDSYGNHPNVDYLVPVSQYEWESGSQDASLESSISIFLPSKTIIGALELSQLTPGFGKWKNQANDVIFIDPSVDDDGPSTALIKKDSLFKWLEANNLQLIWLVAGEKNLYYEKRSGQGGRLVFSGLYKFTDNEVSGEDWFIDQRFPK